MANTTLNRLIAGDFLESLGKELGLEVPPDLPPSKKGQIAVPQTEAALVGEQSNDILPVEDKRFPTPSSTGIPLDHRMTGNMEVVLNGRNEDDEVNHNLAGNGGKIMEISSSKGKSGKVNEENMSKEDRKANNRRANVHRDWSDSSSSEDEKRKKRLRRRRYKSSNSDDSSSSDYRNKEYSRSRDRKKGSSQEKRSRRKHSNHHKHRHRDSSPRDHHRSGKERTVSEREKHRWRD